MVATTPERGSIVSAALSSSRQTGVAVRTKVKLTGESGRSSDLVWFICCVFGPALKGELFVRTLDSCIVSLVVFLRTQLGSYYLMLSKSLQSYWPRGPGLHFLTICDHCNCFQSIQYKCMIDMRVYALLEKNGVKTAFKYLRLFHLFIDLNLTTFGQRMCVIKP